MKQNSKILIAAGGIVVAWLAGVRVKFFTYSALLFIALNASNGTTNS